jgi:transposase-like protein
MATRISPEVFQRTRVLVTATTTPVRDIAAEVGVSTTTVRDWTRLHGWERPPGAERLIKLPPERAGAAQRLYEGGASAEDLAGVLGCGASYIHQYAREHRWTRRPQGEAEPAPLSEEVAAVEAALRDPDLSRRDLVRLIERAVALTAADVLATGAARAERRTAALGRLAAIARGMPEDPGPAPAGDPEYFPDANELIEEIARRFEEFCATEDELALQGPPGFDGH